MNNYDEEYKTVTPDCTGCPGRMGESCIYWDPDAPLSVILTNGSQYDNLRMVTCDRKHPGTENAGESTKVTFAQCQSGRKYQVLSIPVAHIVVTISEPLECPAADWCKCDPEGNGQCSEVV